MTLEIENKQFKIIKKNFQNINRNNIGVGYMIKLITFNNGLFNFVLNIDYFYSGNAFFFHNFFEQVDVVYLVCNLTLSHRVEKRLGNKFDCSLSVSAVHSPSHVNIF